MFETLEFVITLEEDKERLDKILSQKLSEHSRSVIQKWIENGDVLVNDIEVKSNTRVKVDDLICVNIPEVVELKVEAEAMDLDILYEDHDVIVVNKPKGLVVHPGAGNPSHTLVNGLLAHCKDLSGINGILRPGIVHRIDKDTSGCLVVAKNDLAHQGLSDQLQARTLKRTYVALVHGIIVHNLGKIEAPIGRDRHDRQKMTVTSMNARPALTHFKVLKRYDDMTLVECQLETGRTHQIRVHFEYIGFPLVGDPKYAKRSTLDTQGQMLHAQRIEFTHPRTGERLHFEAPAPEVFAKVIRELEEKDANR